jgi:Bacterial Ig-like domain (group 3)/Invasin, domain 3
VRRIMYCRGRTVLRSMFEWAPARWFMLGAVLSTALSAWLLSVGADAAVAQTVTVKLSPSSIVADGTSTSTATATVSEVGVPLPGQTVAFSSSDNGIHLSPVTDNLNGTYTATLTSSTVAGTATITATDQSALPPAAGQATLTQTPGPATNMTLSLQPQSIIADGSSYTTATATVADAHGNPVPMDSVAFSSSDPGERVLQVANNGNGTYSALIRSSTTPGQATINAADASANLSVHAEVSQTASGGTLALVAFPSAVVTNEGVTLFAVVTSKAGSPSGTISFANGRATIGGCVADPITPSNSIAICQTSFTAATSPEQLTAVFTPNASSNVASATGTATVTVSPDSSSTSLDASKTVAVGASTIYTAAVAAPASRLGPIEPSGTVEFLDGGQPIGACLDQALTNGGATCKVAYNATSTHSITARYRGDANFKSSSSSPQSVSVVPLPARVLGIITSTIQWNFYYAPDYTKILSLVLHGAPVGASVIINCHGRGCPFTKRVTAVANSKRCGPKGKRRCATGGTIDLAPAFQKHRLHVGTQITVAITRPQWIGKYYTFVTRAGHPPGIRIACLAPGRTRPSGGC